MMPYITYLPDSEYRTNTDLSHAGIGNTKEESRKNACYCDNRWPWVVTVAASRAPRWAQREAVSTRENELLCRAVTGCEPRRGEPSPLNHDEEKELESYRYQHLYG